jgi:hypothetical protein
MTNWKQFGGKWSWTKSKVLSWYWPIGLGGLQKPTENLSQDCRHPGQNLNPGPPKYGVLSTELWHTVSGACSIWINMVVITILETVSNKICTSIFVTFLQWATFEEIYETSVYFHKTVWHYIPESCHLHIYEIHFEFHVQFRLYWSDTDQN